jgi:hypothetical protein
MSKINIAQITSQVKCKFDEKINKLVNEAQNGTLTEESIQKEIEPYQKKFEKFQQVGDAVSTASQAIKAFKNPAGAAKDLAKQGIKEIIANSETVQNLKKEAMNKIEEKLNEIPQVQEAKNEIERITNNVLSEVKIPQEPSIDPELPSAEKLVAAAIRDSRLARMLIKTE